MVTLEPSATSYVQTFLANHPTPSAFINQVIRILKTPPDHFLYELGSWGETEPLRIGLQFEALQSSLTIDLPSDHQIVGCISTALIVSEFPEILPNFKNYFNVDSRQYFELTANEVRYFNFKPDFFIEKLLRLYRLDLSGDRMARLIEGHQSAPPGSELEEEDIYLKNGYFQQLIGNLERLSLECSRTFKLPTEPA